MFSKILVAVDGSSQSATVCKKAIELAVKFSAQVTFLHVLVIHLSDYENDDDIVLEAVNVISLRAEQAGARMLEDIKKQAEAKGISFSTKLAKGNPAGIIIDEAVAGKYDLIIVGNRELGGIKGFLMGSVSSRVSHSAPCSVLIAR